jgi:hypothetical protein
MPWAKLHTDILGDPKLMRAARKGARDLIYLPWLIAFAKLADDAGRLTVGEDPAEAADIAPLIPGASVKSVAVALASLESIGILARDDGALRFTRWEVRSEAKPSDSASAIGERVKRFRDKQRNADSNALPETPSNALRETLDNATEKRREEEKREEERRGERNGADAPPSRPLRAVPAWLVTLGAQWESRVGTATPAALRRLLGGAVAMHGESAIAKAVDLYASERIEQGKPMKLEWFAAEVAGWVERTKPIVDADGILTARGMGSSNGAGR